MKKETIIALFLGISTGTIIAVILLINAQKITIKDKNVMPTEAPKAIKLPETTQPFIINEPQNNAIVDKPEVTIRASVPSASSIVTQSQYTEQFFEPETNDFSYTQSLERGENIIRIVNYLNNIVTEKMLTIYYLPEE